MQTNHCFWLSNSTEMSSQKSEKISKNTEQSERYSLTECVVFMEKLRTKKHYKLEHTPVQTQAMSQLCVDITWLMDHSFPGLKYSTQGLKSIF